MFEENIKAGASLLDEKIPGWMERQNLMKFDLKYSCSCVLGWAEDTRDYWTTLEKLFPGKSEQELLDLAAEHGFNIKFMQASADQGYQDYSTLTDEWKVFIAERRRSVGSTV
jgi:hypothetical protein